MNEAVAVMNDQGLAEICRLLEREDMLISPDAVWLSSRPGFYGHLLALDAIAISRERAMDILCPECGTKSMRPQPHAAPESQPYRGYCPECGWVGLANQQAHYWQVQPQKLAKWLSAGLGLAPRYAVEPIVDNVLWRLGEFEHRRRRHTVFFGRRLSAMSDQVAAKLAHGQEPELADLFTGFRQGMAALLGIGVWYLVVFCALGIGVALMAVLLGVAPSGEALSQLTPEAQASLMELGLVVLVLALPLMMAYWLAPALVYFEQQSGIEAMRLSLLFAARNWPQVWVLYMVVSVFFVVVVL